MAGGSRRWDEKCKVDSLVVFWAGHKRQGLRLFLSLPRGKGRKRGGKGGERRQGKEEKEAYGRTNVGEE